MSKGGQTMLSALANLPRLWAAMDNAKIDLLVTRSGENFTYLSGIVYPGTLARHLDLTGSPRAAMLLVPRSGDPEVFLNDFAAGFTRLKSPIPLTLYEGYRDDPYEALGKRLRALGYESSTIGVEKNYVGAAQYESLRSSLPNARFIDVTEMLEQVRWVKTPEEIALFRRAGALLDKAYMEVFPGIRPGDSERVVHARLMESCLRLGFEYAHGILNTHRNPVIYNGESDLRFERGDVVRTDYVAYLQGYPGHQSRNATLGKAAPEIVAAYRKVRDVYQVLVDSIRPGVLVHDLYQKVLQEYERRDLRYESLLVGHSVGAWFHQQEPILRRDSTIVLEEGMVLALEPYYQSFHIQDLVAVTAKGCEILTPDIDTNHMYEIEI